MNEEDKDETNGFKSIPSLELFTPVKFKAYPIIERAVEEGIAYGYRRAHKHVDNPTESAIKDAIRQAVMGELCEILSFDTEC